MENYDDDPYYFLSKEERDLISRFASGKMVNDESDNSHSFSAENDEEEKEDELSSITKYNEEEIFTFFATRIIDKTMNLSTAINNLFPSVSSVLNFIISILFLLES